MPAPRIGDTYTDATSPAYRFVVETIEIPDDGFDNFFIVTVAPPDDPTAPGLELTPSEWEDFCECHRLTGSVPTDPAPA